MSYDPTPNDIDSIDSDST